MKVIGGFNGVVQGTEIYGRDTTSYRDRGGALLRSEHTG